MKGKGVNTDTMYCHDPSCKLFNEPVEIRWAGDTWDAPAEWIDDPECKVCAGELREHQRGCEDCGGGEDELIVNEAGLFCESCLAEHRRASLAECGGERLLRGEARLNREAREQEGTL